MKRYIAYGLAITLLGACSTKEIDIQDSVQDDIVFYACFEQPSEGTKVYANEDLLLRWNADDRVSIFEKKTYNQQFKFTGETGDNAGGFKKVEGDDYYTGNAIPNVVSVYPYQESTKITESEVLTVTLPAEQTYAENTFGLGANTMVSVSSDNYLQYKNVGGYLMLKLYGEGVSVSSITLKGNNGEKIAGKATITMLKNGTPTVSMTNDATDEISLVCDTPIALNTIAEESTEFWFVVPPVTFSKGFTITVAGDDGVFVKKTEKSLTIDRNKLSRMSSVEVELSAPRNIIYYTSTDGSVVTPMPADGFGATIISNEYVDGLGIITFDGDVTSIGEYAFRDNTLLTSMTIPEGVTSIGTGAFNYCSNLTSINIPKSVKSIGDWAFSDCTSLTNSITIPESMTSIGIGAFCECLSLSSFEGKFVSSDGVYLIVDGSIIAVAGGSIDGEVVIPEGVTSIGSFSFEGYTNLTSVSFPEGMTSIGGAAFALCTGLNVLTIPKGVTSIGSNAFQECTSLTSITISESVTSIGISAFWNCTNLTSVIVLPVTPPSLGDVSFNRTNDCPIYVPAGSVDAYKSAKGWSEYADRIQAIPSVPIPETVDMGLSVKWASFNLGASAPEEYGDYYAWGETEPYYSNLDPLTWKEGKEAGYAWASYKWCMGSSYTLTKYCNKTSSGYEGFTDSKTVLDPEDDAAHVNLGGSWRMPTDAEWTELSENCTWTWTTQNGVNGRLVTATNGNSIFLPMAGHRFIADIYDVGSYGRYWSSSLDTDNPYRVWRMYFNYGSVYRNCDSRNYGLSVRPVTE